MIVAEAISRKIDDEKTRLQFKVGDTEDPSAEAWRSLIDVDDEIFPIKDLAAGIIEETLVVRKEEAGGGVGLEPAEEIVAEDDEDGDLPTYPVPESDAEDSDDDPTLISREKTPQPLFLPLKSDSYGRYIRDLLKYLQSDKYEKQHIALKTAPRLIRQKATFGTELTDQAGALARVLTGMQDAFEMDEFQEMRLAGLVALVACAPDVVGYVVETYFSGDLSIQQRLVLLSALGLGARELADLDKKVPQSLRGC